MTYLWSQWQREGRNRRCVCGGGVLTYQWSQCQCESVYGGGGDVLAFTYTAAVPECMWGGLTYLWSHGKGRGWVDGGGG